jgi:hypothetical protein
MYSRHRIAREILFDELRRRRALDVELRGEAERAHSVDQAEVHRLDVAALLGRDVPGRHAEDLGRRGAVDVLAVLEGAQQRRVLGQCAMMRSSICE